MSEDATAVATPPVDRALALVTTLAGEVGPRRPTSTSERIAAELVGDALRSTGIDVRTDPFAALRYTRDEGLVRKWPCGCLCRLAATGHYATRYSGITTRRQRRRSSGPTPSLLASSPITLAS